MFYETIRYPLAFYRNCIETNLYKFCAICIVTYIQPKTKQYKPYLQPT